MNVPKFDLLDGTKIPVIAWGNGESLFDSPPLDLILPHSLALYLDLGRRERYPTSTVEADKKLPSNRYWRC